MLIRASRKSPPAEGPRPYAQAQGPRQGPEERQGVTPATEGQTGLSLRPEAKAGARVGFGEQRRGLAIRGRDGFTEIQIYRYTERAPHPPCAPAYLGT
jgi:hypothetical protein